MVMFKHFGILTVNILNLALVVGGLYNAGHWINSYAMDKCQQKKQNKTKQNMLFVG